jgi:hypothetical protein
MTQADIEYWDYLQEHLSNVKKAHKTALLIFSDIPTVASAAFQQDLQLEVDNHDMSKFTETEWAPYRDRFILKKRDVPEFKAAWEHHKKYNPHHWETWTQELHSPCWMLHAVHNVIDWMAMALKFGDTAHFYYEKNKSTILIPQAALPFFTSLLVRTK